MRNKGVKYVCGNCGAQLSGIGDWVEHICPSLMPRAPAYVPQSRRRKPRARAVQVQYQRWIGSRTIPLEIPAKSFEQLLTSEDHAWMREMEKAFRHS